MALVPEFAIHKTIVFPTTSKFAGITTGITVGPELIQNISQIYLNKVSYLIRYDFRQWLVLVEPQSTGKKEMTHVLSQQFTIYTLHIYLRPHDLSSNMHHCSKLLQWSSCGNALRCPLGLFLQQNKRLYPYTLHGYVIHYNEHRQYSTCPWKKKKIGNHVNPLISLHR